jgi:hypothetical protein
MHMKKLFLILFAAALLITSCGPVTADTRTDGTNNPPTVGNDTTTDGNTAGGMNDENGTVPDNSADAAAPDGASDGMYNRGSGTGTNSLRRDANGSSGSLRRSLRKDFPSDTLGDLDGDGFIENTLTDGPDEAASASRYRTVSRVDSAEDVKNFIGANVLALCGNDLPEMAEARILRDSEFDRLADRAGLTDADGVRDAVLMKASGDDEKFSVLVLRTDGTHTKALSHSLGGRVDTDEFRLPGTKTVAVSLDDDVVLLSGDKAEVNAALRAIVKAADGVYDRVWDARVVAG